MNTGLKMELEINDSYWKGDYVSVKILYYESIHVEKQKNETGLCKTDDSLFWIASFWISMKIYEE